MNQSIITSHPLLSELLKFQQDFPLLVHQNIYHNQHQNIYNACLQFQINQMLNISDKYNQMIKQLTNTLINKKQDFDMLLRSSFHKILQADYLPLIKINRYQITYLSIFGFDIYLEPLQAFLRIVNKLQTYKQQIINSPFIQKINIKQSLLQNGWQYYSSYLPYWKISFNIYMLKQYLRIGGKSFLKKDRQILFTGIINFYQLFVPYLKNNHNCQLLKQIAQLNNYLYNFHPSFNYFHFYSLLVPTNLQLLQVFSYTKQIAMKCLNTNILTPLLLGIIKYRNKFIEFIQQVNDPQWKIYINCIVSGLALNFKLRILQYQQVMQILQKAVIKVCILGQIDTSYIIALPQKGWRQAKQFFISAIKNHTNLGDSQTWKNMKPQDVGNRVLNAISDGITLNITHNEKHLTTFCQNLQIQLDNQIKKITQNRSNLQQISTSIYQFEHKQWNISYSLSSIRIINILSITNLFNQYSFNFALNLFKKLKQFQQKQINKIIQLSADILNNFIINNPQINLIYSKQDIYQFQLNNPPKYFTRSLMEFYLANYQPKKSFFILVKNFIYQQHNNQLYDLISCCITLPTHKVVQIKTFQQIIIIKSDYINPPYQISCFLSVLVDQIIIGNKNIQYLTQQIILAHPWIAYQLLRLPISTNKQMISFGHYCINFVQKHYFVKKIYLYSLGRILSQFNIDLAYQLIYPFLLEYIFKKLNENDNIDDITSLVNLILWFYQINKQNKQKYHQLLIYQIYNLNKCRTYQVLYKYMINILVTSYKLFQGNIQVWIKNMLSDRRIKGFQIISNTKRQVLKSNKNSLFVILSTGQQTNQQILIQNKQSLIQRMQNFKIQLSQNIYLKQNIQLFNNQINNSYSQQQQSYTQQFQMKYITIPALQKQFVQYLCRQSLNNQQIVHILNIISLNSNNYNIIINFYIQNKLALKLAQSQLTINLLHSVNKILFISEQANINVLSQMSKKLNLYQKQKISAQYNLQQSAIQLYTKHIENIQYLSAYNNQNWRKISVYINQKLAKIGLVSIIMQYTEFVIITGNNNQQFDKNINQYVNLLQKMLKLFMMRIQNILQKQLKDDEKQIKIHNQILFINNFIQQIQLSTILSKLSILNNQIKIRNKIQQVCFIDVIFYFNVFLCNVFQSDSLVPDFIYGYKFTNQFILNNLHLEIGIYLEQYFIATQSKQANPSQIRVQPQINQKQFQLKISKFIQNKILYKNQQNLLSINFNQNNLNMNQHYIVQLGQNIYKYYQNNLKNFTPIIQQVLTRSKFQWQILKNQRSQIYHYIKAILATSQIQKKQLVFQYNKQQLIEKGRQIKVTQQNFLSYCNQIGKYTIGKNNYYFFRFLIKGYLQGKQKQQSKNE